MQIIKQKSNEVLKIPQLIQNLKKYGQLTLKDMSSVILQISSFFKNEPNLLNLTSPLLIVGDIHGQFYDLLNLLDRYGSPQSKQMLFLGDYVDRGSFSIEVITLLFMYKLRHPTKVHLLRGNHECRSLTSVFNFKTECLAKYNQTIYEEIMNIFDQLPLCAVIDKKYFAVHGGISPQCKFIKEIQEINRFKETPQKGEFCDFLWSDPLNVNCDHWRQNHVRQCSYFFGVNQAKNFLNRNNLKLIIRGHEVEKQGYKYQKNNNVPLTLTIFSAPNYGDVYQNYGCIAELNESEIKLHCYDEVKHPLVLPNFQNALEWTIPFLGSCINHAIKHLLTIDNNKVSRKIKGIMTSKQAFQQDLKLMETAKIIDKILSMETKIQDQAKAIENQIPSSQKIKERRGSFTAMKKGDENEKMPKIEVAKVIGPKLSQSCRLIKEIETSSEEEQEQEQDWNFKQEDDFSLRVVGPSMKGLQFKSDKSME